MPWIHVNVEVELDAGDGVDAREVVRLLREAALAVLDDHGIDDAEISLTLLGDDEIADLNERFLRHEGPTDVIAFTMHEPDEPPLGDVYIGWDQAKRQAREHGVSDLEELARLAVHGTLHVLGHDHPDGEDRLESPMWRRQEAILQSVIDNRGA